MGYRVDELEAEPVKMGEIEFHGKENTSGSVKFDKLAISGRGELLLVSLIADNQRVKQIRAIVSFGAKSSASGSGVKVKQPSQEDYYAHTPGHMQISPEGYQCFTHKIGYGMAHALFVTRSPGFMKVVTLESLWQELNDIRFTTPILKEWIPYLDDQLRATERLEEAHVFNCRCGILSATTAKLDEIVEYGLSRRNLIIPLPIAS